MKLPWTICAALILAAPCFAQTSIQFTAIQAQPSNRIELVWSSDTARWYAIERTANLTNWNYDFDFVIPDGSAPLTSNNWTLAVDTNRCFFRLFGSSPIGREDTAKADLGTTGSDFQWGLGAAHMDYFLISGQGGSDTQHVEGGASDDWLVQLGGTGDDQQSIMGGSGNDLIYQVGGEGRDTMLIMATSGGDQIIQRGGAGNDRMNAHGGSGGDWILQSGGGGNDVMDIDVNTGNDVARVDAGEGDDWLRYELGPDVDVIEINGGAGRDTLIVEGSKGYIDWVTNAAYLIQDQHGSELYATGLPDTVISIIDIELIHVVGTNGMTNWSWSAP